MFFFKKNISKRVTHESSKKCVACDNKNVCVIRNFIINEYTPGIYTTMLESVNNIRSMNRGIKNEIGEMIGVLKKAYREEGSFSSDTLDAMRDEIGDVFYYIAGKIDMSGYDLCIMHDSFYYNYTKKILGEYGIDFDPVYITKTDPDIDIVEEFCFAINRTASEIDNSDNLNEFMICFSLLANMLALSMYMFGYYLKPMMSNRQKLASRKERNVITGNGDKR